MEDFLLWDASYSDEERLIRDSVRHFVDETVLPVIGTAYEAGEFPKAFIEKTAALGLIGMTLPESDGGLGASDMAYGLVCQELERGDSGLRSFVSVQSSLCLYPIYTYGSEVQKKKYLSKMMTGEYIACFGLTEPNAGSDPASMQTFAKKVSDGWILNGSKLWITNAVIADLAIVWAKTEAGIRGFIVEKAFKGFQRNFIKNKGSLRASSTGELVFEDCFVPDENFLPRSDCGIKAPLSCLSQARFGIAFGAIGAAMACYESALSYAKSRIQFSKPIASFQLVQNELVDMFSEIVSAQAVNHRLARLKEAKQLTPMMISFAKRNACRHALGIARRARNVLGANGISLEYPVIRHMANLESVFTYEGTDMVHTLILGKHITGISAFE